MQLYAIRNKNTKQFLKQKRSMDVGTPRFFISEKQALEFMGYKCNGVYTIYHTYVNCEIVVFNAEEVNGTP